MPHLRYSLVLPLLACALLRAGDPAVLLDPLKVHGDQQGFRIAPDGQDIPTSYLVSRFPVSMPTSDPGEAWSQMLPLFDKALRRMGLEPMQGTALASLGGMKGAQRVKDARLYCCGNHGALERLRNRLLFINEKGETRGSIRQILIGVSPVPDSALRGPSKGGWQDEMGLRIYVIGHTESGAHGEDLPFDVTPLAQDIATALESSVR